MSKLSSITVNVDFDTIRSLSNMDTDEIEMEEGNIDTALFYAFQNEFSEADEVKASCGYVSSLTVQSYDDDGDHVSVDDSRIQKAIKAAIDSL